MSDVKVGDNGGTSDVDGGEKVQNIILHASKTSFTAANLRLEQKWQSICLDSFSVSIQLETLDCVKSKQNVVENRQEASQLILNLQLCKRTHQLAC